MRNRFDRELEALNRELMEMGFLIEQAIENAVDAVLAEGWRTADIAEPGVIPIGTREMGRRIREKL